MDKLQFEPVDIAGLWSLQGNRRTPLADLVGALFASGAQPDAPLQGDGLCLLPLWPHQAYLLADQATAPAAAGAFEPLLTDIAHGHRRFRLRGEQAFDFAASYLSADITALRHAPACRRCRLGQYTPILWWDDHRDLQLLLERSYAESFADYIATLVARWRPGALC